MAALDWSECSAVESVPGGSQPRRPTIQSLMRVLFDNGTPRGVAAALSDHVVEEAPLRGWDTLTNGQLLDAAEAAGFEVFVTTDRNIRYQQQCSIGFEARSCAGIGLACYGHAHAQQLYLCVT